MSASPARASELLSSDVVAPDVRAREAVQRACRSRQEADLSWLGASWRDNEWSLAEDTLSFISRLVAVLRPRRIVEFGSGVSTRALARAGGGLDPPAKVVALENDPLFRGRTRRSLDKDGSATTAEVRLTPVVVRRWFGNNVPVYHLDRPCLSAMGSPELVVVDGPPLPLGGREGSLLQAVHLGRVGTVVLLDDADRASEAKAMARALEVCGDAVEPVELDGFAKGLGALVLTRSLEGPAMPPSPSGNGGAP